LKPRVGLVLGDGGGIGAELAAKLLALPETAGAADITVIGDRRLLARGAKESGVAPRIDAFVERLDGPVSGVIMLDRAEADPSAIRIGEISVQGAGPALDNYRVALDLVQAGRLDAITFVPFNKQAMRLVDAKYEDELVFAAEYLGFKGAVAEFNIIDQFWNARVTSHVPLRDVASLITQDRIIQRLTMTRDALIEAGVAEPRIGVAALNPHAGDGGAFGREDLDIITPAVAEARRLGIVAEGPYPSDTVYVRAAKGAFDAVLSMYHDQGQIAIKLLGFDSGVTLLGGLPVPITTPAHGTAYDIAGRGIANIEPTHRAFDIAVRMAERRTARAAKTAEAG
jgi:4-hydroxythreonine-4-phosphate dehydrogenase